MKIDAHNLIGDQFSLISGINRLNYQLYLLY